MKKLNKKTKLSLLGMGTAAAVALPIATVVSCGTSYVVVKDHAPTIVIGTGDSSKISLKSVNLPTLKKAFTDAGITQSDLDKIGTLELHKIQTHDSTIDPQIKATVDNITQVILEWAFKNNNDAEKMRELTRWITNSAVTINSSSSKGRGPWKTDSSKGKISYYRNDLIDLKTLTSFSGVDLVGSKFKNAASKKKFITYNSLGATDKGTRPLAMNIASGNTFSSTKTSNTSFSIYRSKRVGADTYHINTKGNLVWDSKESTTTDLFGGLNVKVGDSHSMASVSGTSLEALGKAIENAASVDTIVFENSASSVNYAKTLNKSIVDTKTKFNAKDLFYGFIRSIYSSSSFRKTGILNKVDLNSVLPKMSTAELTQFVSGFENTAGAEKMNNANFYLLDLYGVDLLETIKANVASTDETKFIIKFKKDKISKSSTELFSDNSLFTPFAKSLLKDPSNSTFNATQLRVSDYGNPYSGKGDQNVEGLYALTPYLFTKMEQSVGGEQLIEKNPFYVDQAWVNDPLSVPAYALRIEAKNLDATAKAQSRKHDFLDAVNTGLFILDESVRSDESLLADLTSYKVTKSLDETGATIARGLYWNYYGYINNGFNNKGREMMWGKGNMDASKIESDKNAMVEFFSGTGALTRTAMNAAVNWYTMAQTIMPNQGKIFYPSVANPEEYTISGLNPLEAYPTYMGEAYPEYLRTTSTQKEIYNYFQADKDKQWKSASFDRAAKTIDELANSVGATAANPAQIPVFKYQFSDTTTSPEAQLADSQVLKILNQLSDKVKFVSQVEYSWSEFVAAANTNKTASTIIQSWWGPDYSGLGSIDEQFLKSYGSFGSVALAKELLK